MKTISDDVKVLVAEDEAVILMQYKMALEGRGHQVLGARDGEECLRLYEAEIHNSTEGVCPFDAVLLDYRMPKMDGMEVAKRILASSPSQRIIIASAFTKEALVESVKQLKQVVELLQKPFELDVLGDVLEDKEIFSQLEMLNVKVAEIKGMNPTHEQVRDLLEGLNKIYAHGTDDTSSVSSASA
ncbi:MAG TPA: response regulator [Nitrososphaera sp.]